MFTGGYLDAIEQFLRHGSLQVKYEFIAVRVYSIARTSRVLAIVIKLNTNMLCCLVLTGVVTSLLSGCGNKGDLFLVSDETTEQELQLLEQGLGSVNNQNVEPAIKGETATDTIDNILDLNKTDKKNQPSSN